MKTLKNLTGLYSLSKTLRFELKPIGKTKENIEKNGILERDNERAIAYKAVKKVIDEYHKAFIELMLDDFELNKDTLNEFYYLYHLPTSEAKRKTDLPKVQEVLRKQISERFTKSEQFKRLFGKELIREDLVEFVKTPQYENIIRKMPGNEQLTDKEVKQIQERVQKDIAQFDDFTTYFSGFYDNRKNMYVPEDIATSIAHRMIGENLPKFIDNMDVFARIAASDVATHFDELNKAMELYLNVNEIPEMFQLDYFHMVLTQKQIDVYNAIIGGKVLDDGTKVQGLNEYVNLYNQQQKDKSKRLPKLKPLFKQILSERNAISWLPDEFDSDNEMLQSIGKCYHDLKEQVFGSLKTLLGSIKDYDLEHIYLPNDLQLTDIAQKHFGDWSVIKNAVIENLQSVNPKKKRENGENYDERILKLQKANDSYSIGFINALLRSKTDDFNPLENYFAGMGAEDNENGQKLNHFARIENAYTEVKTLLNADYPEGKSLSQDKANVEKIKNLLDSIKDLQHYVKPLLGSGMESDKDNRFYGEFTPLWEALDQITPLYNMVRNRMTQKPYSDEKIKLNFDNSTLLAGWDLNKEADNTCTLLRKDGNYYLAIINKRSNKVLKPENLISDGDCYEKMEYKLLPGANKMLPKVFFSKSRIDEFKPSESVLKNYQKETHKKGDNFNLDDCHALIDFFKESINKHEDWSKFGFHFSDTNSYEDLSGFYREVEQQGYKISFRNVSVNYINQLVDEGKIYLFQIYNKDFSPYSKGTPNMHTLYWRMLFDERNLADVVYKLNGEAEVFFRKHSIRVDKPTHPANKPIANKNAQNEKKESIFTYDLVKDRRYTVDKFQFHVPITMNFKAAGLNNINPLVNAYLKESNSTHIIGIDRGERHLLYLSLIDMKGNIVEQYTLNEIVNEYKGNTYRTNYHDLLDAKEKQRDEARRSWQTIENIKELKEGYMSQVIHKIAELMVKHNAIVVLEDLNMGFMRGRQKVEKQVYQKFEKMLIDKLNYLVDKKLDAEEMGGVLNAYQLTNKFEGFQKLGKQSGFLFYIPAWNTSKMDPTTGFVNLFDTRYENMEKSKVFFGKFDSIRYNSAKGWFEFAFDYGNFTAKAEGTRTNWTLCTYGTRIETKRNPEKNNEFDSVEIDLTEQFKALFAKHQIDLSGNLKEQICNQSDASFHKELLHLLHLTLQMRNSVTNSEVDFLLSPVMNASGEFYDSRTCGKNLPENADANGAYNIARKGLWIIEQIKNTNDNDLAKIKLAISNKEWLRYAQGLD
ncbi:MAG: type V CRISPR-associated protein Cas12a/Cpf1 [Paludibacteraceae bacterium]|nr:type V CRISPR-associated protein Cas12a/Cpf1 [Paludibacteraceae bacterium]